MRSICRSIDYPVFGNAETVILPDCLAEVKPDFSGFMAHQGDKVMLVITDAAEGMEVFVNNKSMGIQIVLELRYGLTKHWQMEKTCSGSRKSLCMARPETVTASGFALLFYIPFFIVFQREYDDKYDITSRFTFKLYPGKDKHERTRCHAAVLV